jgi:tRNA-splicing endonuclease subunit Sen34
MDSAPDLPIPISFINGRYLLFSADAVTYLRREHNIGGVFMGTLPHVPQQNVFLGLPLLLMPEEARVLVEKGVARIFDDAKFHDHGMRMLIEADKHRYQQGLDREGSEISQLLTEKKESQREKALKNAAKRKNAKAKATEAGDSKEPQIENGQEDNESLFGTDSRSVTTTTSSTSSAVTMAITPATSFPLLPQSAPEEYTMPLPEVPSSYPIYAHLHLRGYFLSPGLRFGCQYVAYPGDSLRFHSHFLVVGTEWDQQINLMDIVSGGRLGTGVKKGYLFGGAEPSDSDSEDISNVRSFSVEWAGM